MSDETKSEYKFIDHTYDVVVVGAGGAGLRATFGCADAGLKTACITKAVSYTHLTLPTIYSV